MSESRARRRIRQAVELYGYRLVRLDWEPVSAGAEKSGPDGGWFGEIERADGVVSDPLSGGDHAVLGYNVEHALDWIDEFVKPVEPCGHSWTIENSLARKRAQVQTHPEGCRYHLTYSLPWFASEPPR